MSEFIFPEGKTIFQEPLSRESLQLILEKIQNAEKAFNGFIKTTKGYKAISYLFFVKGKPYAAGEIVNSRPSSIAIKDFFGSLSIGDKKGIISLHETGPLIVKCLLVFIQKEPGIKAPSVIVDLEGIIKQIGAKDSDFFVILKKYNFYNFFYFMKGGHKESFFADTTFIYSKDAPVEEQLLLYAYPQDVVPVEVFFYSDTTTRKAIDAEEVVLAEMRDMISKEEVRSVVGYCELLFVEGAQQGKSMRVNLPCIIGRKSTDVIVNDSLVSRQHASLRKSEERLIIEDLNSKNGTLVNGKEIKVKELSKGDIITLGRTSIRIEDYHLA